MKVAKTTLWNQIDLGKNPLSVIGVFLFWDDKLSNWIKAIPFEEWPQQTRLPDGKIRPAMVNDLSWNDFGAVTGPTVVNILSNMFDQHYVCRSRMLSVVMPGHSIHPHRDQQDAGWVCRVHVPITTNDRAYMIVEGEVTHMRVGRIYAFDTRREHAVFNEGDTPRIHLMFDVIDPHMLR